MTVLNASLVSDAELTPRSMLQLMWLASPALPIGGFSYSEGMEAAINADLVATENEAADWLVEQLHLTQARGDMAAVAQAFSAWQRADTTRVAQLNQWVLMTRETSELRLQTEQMGRSLADWLRNQHAADPRAMQQIDLLHGLSAGQPTYPIAFALAVSLTGAPLRHALLSYAFGWAENMVQAAIKAIPLGQIAGQRVLAKLAAQIPDAVAYAATLPDEDRQTFSPMLAILSAQHEHQYSRLFRS